jgi:phosphatidylglycerol:prolipoprotein diacylglycerol transferase
LIGRIGCFLVGDDYGRPTDLPWGVAFPEGLPPTTTSVHPTQLYEAVGLGVLGWLLLGWRRSGVPDAIVLGRYLIGAGALRFVIEFVRVNERVVGVFSIAHGLSDKEAPMWIDLIVEFMRSGSSSSSRCS